jgi:RNA polymerase sigma factor (sigma-70 family)
LRSDQGRSHRSAPVLAGIWEGLNLAYGEPAASVSLTELAHEEEGQPDRTPASDAPTPEQQAIQDETRRLIRRAIGDLAELDQTVLRLRDIEGLSTAEVCARTGLTAAAVKARFHRARGRLRERLNDYFLGDGE